jgi:hypothetical protein
MRLIKLNGKEFKVKENFAECSIDEISHVLTSQNYLRARLSVADQTRFKIAIFLQLSGVPQDLFMKLTRPQQIDMFNLVRWAFTARIVKKPFDFFEVEGVKYLLPDDAYGNTSSIEMALCNIYYLNFSGKNPNPEMLYYIIATLCRPVRKDLNIFRKMIDLWTGDKREVFNSVLAEERAKLFKEKAPFGVLVAVFQYFEQMNNAFIKRYDDVFSGGDGKPLFKNGEGWLAMLADIAETGVMGDLDKVYQSNAISLMMYVQQKQKKVGRIEEMREAQNKE